MRWRHLILVSAFALTFEKAECNNAALHLFDHLMYSYNKQARPILNSTDLLTIKFGASLIRIIDVDLKNQVFTANLWLHMEWIDSKLSWNPADYDNLTKLHIPTSHIWTPDIVLYNNAAGNPEITILNDATVFSSGRILWKPPAIYKSFCPILINYFPYDVQECMLKFGLWTYSGWYVDMRQSDVTKLIPAVDKDGLEYEYLDMGMDLSYFYESAEWDLMKVTNSRHERIYLGCCGSEKYVDITFYFRLKRKTLFFTVNLIIPCFLISFLTTFVFYLSDHKITFAISILITQSVFLVVLIEIIPSTSTVIPMIGKYLLLTMILVTLSIMISVVSVNFHFRRGSTDVMPPLIRKIFIDTMPRLLRMERFSPGAAYIYPPSEHRAAFSRDLLGQRIVKACQLQHACGPTARYLYDVQCKARMAKLEKNRTETNEVEEVVSKKSPVSNEELERQLHSRLVRQILTCVAYVSEHYRANDEDEQESDDWAFVALVIDRLFLILYAFFNVGTLFIVLTTPTLYDSDKPLPIITEPDKPFGAM